jgi:FkbH-like protein
MKTMQEIRAEVTNFRFNDYFRNLKTVEENLDTSELKPLKIAILRSYTVEMIKPLLKLRLLLEGFKPEFFFGDYNQFFQEILDPTSRLYHFKPDVILIMVRIEELLPNLIEDFGEKNYQEWEAVIQTTVQQLRTLVETIEKNMPSQILFQNLAPPSNPYWGIYDAQSSHGQTCLVHQFNQLLAQQLEDKKSAFIWDFNGFLQRVGYNTIYDPKMWYLSRNPFKQSAYPAIVNDMLRYVISIIGKGKKCIVLDLDNTLWGGIAGEDGIDGIELGHDYPGSCYRDFQKGLLRLYNRGIILAINSKNNEEDALEIIENHPYMVLRRKYFAAMQINWFDKVSNMKALAQDLNIGIDSMIFIDDNPVECELFLQRCPECEVVCLPGKKYLIPGVLDSLPGIENIKLTDEDRKKGGMYRAQVARKQLERSFDNLDEFLKTLDIEVTIEPATSFSIPRISQLTQKTNQMNLTTRRYTEANIQAFVNDLDQYVFSVSSKDRFGDNGIIGVFILKFQNDECIIDTFLLSCRVIGRNIENSMIAFIADFATKHGAAAVIGEYLPTAKNKPAADMYDKFQFKRINDKLFKADPKQQTFEYPSYIRLDIKV